MDYENIKKSQLKSAGWLSTQYIMADIKALPTTSEILLIKNGTYLYNDGEKIVARNPVMKFNENIIDFYICELNGITQHDFLDMLMENSDSDWFTAEELPDGLVRLACTELSFKRLSRLVSEQGANMTRKEREE